MCRFLIQGSFINSALGIRIGEGDEVIVPTNTYRFYSGITENGATPVFIE